jgi:Skp family chaperone for outer membrane proteins
MTGMSAHSASKTRAPGLAAAWAILISMGVTSVTYNVDHAVSRGGLNLVLALLYGTAPVLAAALLSHIVAEHDGGKVMKGLTFAVMIGAMVLSIGATAAVVKPAAGVWMQWLFGAVTDGAALIALRVIFDARSRKAQAAREAEAAHATVQEATARAIQAEQELATAKAELVGVRGDLEAEVQRLTSALTDAMNKALTKRRGSGSGGGRGSGSKKPAGSGPKTGVPSDVDTQLEALRILGEEPDISGGELGRRLGKSESYGCRLKNRLAGHVAGPEAQ